jgi:pSer/pThr/pTyr-binding forkhead associated (FHA) protein
MSFQDLRKIRVLCASETPRGRILCTASQASLEDLGSKNATRVGGELITGAIELADGDSIRLGAVLLGYRRACTDASTEEEEERRGEASR